MTKKRLFIFCILSILIISCGPSKSLSENKVPKANDETLVNVSLLDRLRMYPGIVTRGQGQSAQVFIRGIAGVNTPKEVLFIVNGTQV